MASVSVGNIDNRHGRIVIELDGEESSELRGILLNHLVPFLTLFIQKNSEYGENAQVLGPAGQFADMWRKMGKLKTALWDGHEEKLVSEGVDEILRDLIGHCFLTLQQRTPVGTGEVDIEDQSCDKIKRNFTSEIIRLLASMADKNDKECKLLGSEDLLNALKGEGS